MITLDSFRNNGQEISDDVWVCLKFLSSFFSENFLLDETCSTGTVSLVYTCQLSIFAGVFGKKNVILIPSEAHPCDLEIRAF